MELTVRGKQIDVGDALTTHVSDTLTPVTEKYFENAIDASVVFSRDAHLFKADISVHAGRNVHLQASDEAPEIYAAFDGALEKIGKRLRRYKRRLVDHGRDNGKPAHPATYTVFDPGPEDVPDNHNEPDQPVVVAEMQTHIETLTVDGAVMRLELGDLPALMFRNEAHGGLNMVYRRRDGHISWVDPKISGEAAA